MDSNAVNTILDTTEFEQQYKPTSLLPRDSIEELDALRQEIDQKRVSVNNSNVAAAASSNAANTGDQEAKSSVDPYLSFLLSERKGNTCQGKDSKAVEDIASYHAGAENIHSSTKVQDQDLESKVCCPTDAIKNICGFLDNLPPEFALEHIITPTVEAGKSEEGLVDHPGTLRTVRSLKDLSVKEIPRLGWPRWKTRNLSESELQRRRIFATQNLCQYLRNKNIEYKVNIPKSSVLEPGTSSIPNITVEDTAVSPVPQTEVEDSGEGSERKAFFYISSCSVPGMGDGSEPSTVSGRFQMPTERPVRRVIRQESREPLACLGTQRCHYIVLVVALMTALIGCLVYHLSYSGIGPEVLRPIGASTAFISFAVCVFSSIYISYLKNYPQVIPVIPHYELLGDVDSVLAMNRTSYPEFVYGEDGYYNTRAPEYYLRQTQSADVLDRHGYGRHQTGSQTDVKRLADESGTDYSSQPQKKFKTGENVHAETDVPVESVQLTDLGSDRPYDGQTTAQ